MTRKRPDLDRIRLLPRLYRCQGSRCRRRPWHPTRGRQIARSKARLRSPAASMGGRTIVRMARKISQAGQGLRTIRPHPRRITRRRFRLPHDKASRSSRRGFITVSSPRRPFTPSTFLGVCGLSGGAYSTDTPLTRLLMLDRSIAVSFFSRSIEKVELTSASSGTVAISRR